MGEFFCNGHFGGQKWASFNCGGHFEGQKWASFFVMVTLGVKNGRVLIAVVALGVKNGHVFGTAAMPTSGGCRRYSGQNRKENVSTAGRGFERFCRQAAPIKVYIPRQTATLLMQNFATRAPFWPCSTRVTRLRNLAAQTALRTRASCNRCSACSAAVALKMSSVQHARTLQRQASRLFL